MIARVVLIAFVIAAPLAAADDFYEQQLRSGKADAQANRLPQAADELRIAAFGLMQQPAMLQEALARLAVVQSALGQSGEASKTIERFVDVEQRFGAYAAVQLDAPVKAKFEDLVVGQVPRATLQATPTLARLASYEFQKIAAMPPSQRFAAYEAGAQREPKNPEWFIALTKESAARDQQADVIRYGTRVLELDPSNRDVRPLLAHARTSRRDCKEALAIIADLDPSKNPDLYADQAVCFAQMSRWKEAETALGAVPSALRNRADVKRAQQLVANENARLASEAARIALEKKRAEDARIAAERQRATTPTRTVTAPPQPAAPQTRGTAAVPQTSSAPAKPGLRSADVIEAARKLIREAKYSEAVRTLRPALQAESDNRQLRLAMLEASVLARDWRTAGSQVPAVTPLVAGEELYMFYASIALYETGRHDEAKLFMEKARPRMVPSPMVDYYVKAILGQQRGS